VEVPASKNAALPLMCLSLLTADPVHLKNLPRVADIESLQDLLKSLGVEILGEGKFQASKIQSVRADYELVRKMRASILVLGPLLAREGRAEVSLPGGCNIGDRPVDIHLQGLKKMGAKIEIQEGYILAEAKRLRACDFTLPFPTVTGTVNLMMAASLADGTSRFTNVAQEPEVEDVGRALVAMGAKISGLGTSQLEIEGVAKLNSLEWTVPEDRIQLLTYLAAGAITQGEVTCYPYKANTLKAVVEKWKEMGCEITEAENRIHLKSNGRLKATDIETAPFPGFPTDAQAQFMACLCLADGNSQVHESVFENRFQHVSELKRMGADIKLKGSVAHVTGVPSLSGAAVMASDLRASASLVLAGLAAKTKTQVLRVYHLDRGYENIEEHLQKLGAKIWRAEQ
jgi:UDP-N-acetylglucosamine 1-carboxyvinyltransferase